MLIAGTRLGPYEIIEPIGAGGMGEVYKARDTRLNRIVAIKKSLAPFDERFEREAHAIASLNHASICSLFDVGPDYLVMEYVDGKPLSGPAPLDEALALARQILDALDAAHRKGIVHRDLKPANILVTRSGVKLLVVCLVRGGHPKAALRDASRRVGCDVRRQTVPWIAAAAARAPYADHRRLELGSRAQEVSAGSR